MFLTRIFRSTAVLVGLTAALVIAALIWLPGESAETKKTWPTRPWAPIDRQSLDPVKVEIGAYRLAIPGRYLDAPVEKDDQAETFQTEDGFYRTTGVFMIMEMPDMTYRTEESYDEWRRHPGWKDSRWVNVLLGHARNIGTAGPSDSQFRIYSGMRESMDEFERRGMRYGLEWLSHPRGYDSYVQMRNDVRTAFIACRQPGTVPSPSCSQFIALRPTLNVKITYGAQYLPEWREIEAKVRARLEGFIAAAGG